MNDGRGRTEAGPLALARRLLGRVIETVRGSEPPTELVPSTPFAPSVVAAPDAPRASDSSGPSTRELTSSPAPAVDDCSDDRVVEVPTAAMLPLLDEPARALLADASWSGLRFEPREQLALVAWRDVDRAADVLRTIEIRCAYGALDACPEITIQDRPVSATLGATSLASDAHRLLVALGTMREGRFVSLAHATLR